MSDQVPTDSIDTPVATETPVATQEAPMAPESPASPPPAGEAAPPGDASPAGEGGTAVGAGPDEGEYSPRQVVLDDLDGMSFEDAIAGTIVEFDDGDIVTGEVVKVDKDEVLLDIGYKSEGVIPARELSIRHDVDPSESVTTGDRI